VGGERAERGRSLVTKRELLLSLEAGEKSTMSYCQKSVWAVGRKRDGWWENTDGEKKKRGMPENAWRFSDFSHGNGI